MLFNHPNKEGPEKNNNLGDIDELSPMKSSGLMPTPPQKDKKISVTINLSEGRR